MRRLFALLTALLLLGGSSSAVFAQDDAPADPRLGDEVTFVDADGNEAAVLVVEDVVDPFEDSADDPPRRSRFVLVVLSVENTGEEILEFDPATVLLQDADGFLYAAEEIDLGEEEPLELADLDAGDDVTGAIGYAVSDDATDLARVFYRPADDRLLLLADLRAGGDGREPTEEATEEATEEPVDETPVATDDCADFITWLTTTAVRVGRANDIWTQVGDADVDDPAVLDTLADFVDEFRSMAEEQRDSNPPPDADDVNEQFAEGFDVYADGLDQFLTAVEQGDETAVDEVIAVVQEGDDIINGAIDDIAPAAAACGIEL